MREFIYLFKNSSIFIWDLEILFFFLGRPGGFFILFSIRSFSLIFSVISDKFSNSIPISISFFNLDEQFATRFLRYIINSSTFWTSESSFPFSLLISKISSTLFFASEIISFLILFQFSLTLISLIVLFIKNSVVSSY